MGWTMYYKGYYISCWGGSYDVRNDMRNKPLFTAKTIKECKDFIKNKLLKGVLE